MFSFKLRNFLARNCKSLIIPPLIPAGRYSTNIYEPDYLVTLLPETPIYDKLNIQMKGYDYSLLENYQRLVHKVANALDLDVTGSWATPMQKLQIQRFKPTSVVVDTEYTLSIYERNVQISEIPSCTYPILLRMIQDSLPEGVSVQVHEALKEHDQIRYVPDNELISLKQQLTEMGGPTKEKKR